MRFPIACFILTGGFYVRAPQRWSHSPGKNNQGIRPQLGTSGFLTRSCRTWESPTPTHLVFPLWEKFYYFEYKNRKMLLKTY